MGIDLMSALMIQGNETMVDTYSKENEKGYGFIVYLMKGGEIHTKIISTLPNVPYDTVKEAKGIGDALVKTIREMDLNPQKSEIEKIIGTEESAMVKKVIDMSKDPNLE